MFKIFDTKCQHYTRPSYKTRKAAQRAADKLDNNYGAYRYYVHEERIVMVQEVRYVCDNAILHVGRGS